jgi:malonyl CoA-acyl carrier protein transacylase
MKDEDQKLALLEKWKIVHDLLIMGHFQGEYSAQVASAIAFVDEIIKQTEQMGINEK